MIEYTIHQIWLQGYEKIPEKYIHNINLIKKYNPKAKYIFWDEKLILNLLKSNKAW